MKKIITSIITIILIMLPALRDYHVGTDSEMYANFLTWGFNTQDWLGFGLEPINSYILGNISYLNWSGYGVYFIIYAVITNYFFIKSINYFSESKITFPLIIFICFGGLYLLQLNNMRQCAAVAIFSYSLIFLDKNDFKKYILIIILATMFHYSAFVFLVLIFIRKTINNNLVKVIVLSVLFIIVVSVISAQLSSLASIIPGMEKFARYSVKDSENNGAKIFLFNISMFLPTLFILNRNRLFNDSVVLIGLYLTVITLAIQFGIAFCGLQTAGLGRMYQYSIFGYILYYSKVAKFLNIRFRMFYYCIYTFILTIYIFIYMYSYGLGGYVPYIFNDYLTGGL